MNLEYFALAKQNLQSQGFRSILTIIALVIGVAAIIALVSLGEGLNQSVSGQFQSLGQKTIIILPGKGFAESAFARLQESDAELVARIPNVDFASAIYIAAAQVRFKNETKTHTIVGVSPNEVPELGAVGLLDIAQGRQLRESDQSNIVVGPRVATRSFDSTLNVQNTLSIGGDNYTIVGVARLSENNFLGQFFDSAIVVNSEVLKNKIAPGTTPSRIIVQIVNENQLEETKERIISRLKRDHGVEDFQVMTAQQVAQTAADVLGIIQLVLLGIAAISLLVGGVGVMNTMYMSVSERTSEVGVMKAIGATNAQIRSIFLAEATLIGLVGGALGILLGGGLAIIVSFIASQSGFELNAVLSLPIILGATLFAIALCLIFGYLPAQNASELDPVDAIRMEK